MGVTIDPPLETHAMIKRPEGDIERISLCVHEITMVGQVFSFLITENKRSGKYWIDSTAIERLM